MQMQFLYLLLAHLTADFLLQPQKLVELKHKTVIAIFFHSIIHFLVTMAFLFPFWVNINVLLVSLGLAMAHGVVDFVKVRAENSSNKYVLLFFLDQGGHLGLLMLAGLLMSGLPIIPYEGASLPVLLYLNPAVVAGFCMLILGTYVFEITAFQVGRKKRGEFILDRRRMLKNMIILGFIYSIMRIFGISRLAAFAFLVF